jgi:hypothetical protein
MPRYFIVIQQTKVDLNQPAATFDLNKRVYLIGLTARSTRTRMNGRKQKDLFFCNKHIAMACSISGSTVVEGLQY